MYNRPRRLLGCNSSDPASLSQTANASLANTFRFGLRPTASLFAALLTRNASKNKIRGCVT